MLRTEGTPDNPLYYLRCRTTGVMLRTATEEERQAYNNQTHRLPAYPTSPVETREGYVCRCVGRMPADHAAVHDRF